MDFMKIIKSLELLLYELMVWLVFYPRSLVMAIFKPQALMQYADAELDDADEDRYSDTLSPPIFLAISLALVHAVEKAWDVNLETGGILADDKNLVAFRLVAFALFPLMMSLRLLRARGVALDRKTLRAPFYAQCFVAAPFALGIDAASIMLALNVDGTICASIAGVAIIWYLFVQTRWFQNELSQGPVYGLGNALRAFFEASFACLILTLLISAF